MIDLYLFKIGLRDLVRPKRLAVAALLVAAPAAVALLFRFGDPDSFDPYVIYNTIASTLLYGFLLTLPPVIFCTGVITQEIEQKTIVYLLTRPVARWRIMLAKFAAAMVGIVATVDLSALLLAVVTVGMGGKSGSVLLLRGDVADAPALYRAIRTAEDPVSAYIKGGLSRRMKVLMGAYGGGGIPPSQVQQALVRDISRRLRGDAGFYSPKRFEGIELPDEAKHLIARKPEGRDLTRLNRLLLEAAYPGTIDRAIPPSAPVLQDLLILPVGALAYGALMLLMATFLRRPLLFGVLFAFGWEWWAPNMQGKFQLVSVMTYLRALARHPTPPAESVDILQFLSGTTQEQISKGVAWTVLGLTIALAVLFAMVLFSVREFVPRDDVE